MTSVYLYYVAVFVEMKGVMTIRTFFILEYSLFHIPLIFKKWDRGEYTELIWLRIGTGSGRM